MDYNFYNFNSSEFESLVQSLMQKLLGKNSLVFGEGPDGGRELTYNGKAPFPNNIDFWDGYWIVQAKFKSRDFINKDNYSWISNNLKKELNKFINKDLKLPDNYIFITNAVLTAVNKKGGRDKIEKMKSEYFDKIPNISVIAYDELCKLIDNNYDVRIAYSHLISTGDFLEKVLSKINVSMNEITINNNEIREKKQNNVFNQQYDINTNLISIDFGTSFSICGVLTSNGNVIYIPSDKGKIVVPSVISFLKDGKFIIGKPEYQYLKTNEIYTISNVKRYIGTEKKYDVFGKIYTVEEIIILILQSLRKNICEFIGNEKFKVLVNKPTNFNIKRTNALFEMYVNAGFDVIRIVNESTTGSIVIDYNHLPNKLQKKEYTTILSIDLGGGTFDVTFIEAFIEKNDTLYEVLASYGDNYLGGYDFDLAIYEYVKKVIREKEIMLTDSNLVQLFYACENVKKSLRYNESTKIILKDIETEEGNLEDMIINISRSIFAKVTEKLLLRVKGIIIKVLNNVLEHAYYNYTNREIPPIDLIFLAGQGSKIFTIENYLKSTFKNIKIIDKYVENAVARGSAIYTGTLSWKFQKTKLNYEQSRLMLDQVHFGILIKCKTIEDKAYYRYQNASISTNVKNNTYFKTILDREGIVPTKIQYEIQIDNCLNSNNLNLEIFEYDQFQEEKKSFLCFFKLKISLDLTKILLVVDVDANSTILLAAFTEKKEFISSIQLNNKFIKHIGFNLE